MKHVALRARRMRRREQVGDAARRDFQRRELDRRDVVVAPAAVQREDFERPARPFTARQVRAVPAAREGVSIRFAGLPPPGFRVLLSSRCVCVVGCRLALLASGTVPRKNPAKSLMSDGMTEAMCFCDPARLKRFIGPKRLQHHDDVYC